MHNSQALRIIVKLPKLVSTFASAKGKAEQKIQSDDLKMNKSSLLTCSFLDINLETSKGSLTANILICTLNAIFSLITFMANAVILHAIKKTQELHSPSFILLFCLAAADLLTGLVCQPFFVAYKIADMVNVIKCRKSAVTVFYIYGLFLLFYLPFCVTIIVNSFTGYTKAVKITYDFAATAVYINSFLNPFVYCWSIREIRQDVKNILRQYLVRV